MNRHFPEIIGLTFATSIVLIFLFASGLGSPALLVAAAGAAGLVAILRARAKWGRA